MPALGELRFQMLFSKEVWSAEVSRKTTFWIQYWYSVPPTVNSRQTFCWNVIMYSDEPREGLSTWRDRMYAMPRNSVVVYRYPVPLESTPKSLIPIGAGSP